MSKEINEFEPEGGNISLDLVDVVLVDRALLLAVLKGAHVAPDEGAHD